MAQVLQQIEGHVATLVLDNEAKHNALSLGMWRDLAAHLARLREAGYSQADIDTFHAQGVV